MRVTSNSVEGFGFSDAHPTATHEQAEQSRTNGSKSKGPVTAEGKTASSRNAFKHGMYAKGILLPGEDPAAFANFLADFREDLSPTGTLQETLVLRAAELAWKLRRLPVVEGAILESARARQESEEEQDDNAGGMGDLLHQLIGKENDGILMRLQRYEVRLERSLQRCLSELRLLKADAVRAEASMSRPAGASGSFLQETSRPDPAPVATPINASENGLGSFRQNPSAGFHAPISGSFGTKASVAVRNAANSAAPIGKAS